MNILAIVGSPRKGIAKDSLNAKTVGSLYAGDIEKGA